MGIRNLFKKYLAKGSKMEVSNEEIKALADMIRNNRSHMSEWDNMFGVLCFNIWHNTSEDFERSHDIQDIEIPFLCAIGVFQNLQNTKFAKKFEFTRLANLAPENVQNSKEMLLKQLPSIKQIVKQITASNDVETIKPFVTVFAQGFLSDFKNNYSEDNPLDYFQKGIEVLYLFINELIEKDRSFFKDLSDYGEYEADIELIIEHLEAAI